MRRHLILFGLALAVLVAVSSAASLSHTAARRDELYMSDTPSIKMDKATVEGKGKVTENKQSITAAGLSSDKQEDEEDGDEENEDAEEMSGESGGLGDAADEGSDEDSEESGADEDASLAGSGSVVTMAAAKLTNAEESSDESTESACTTNCNQGNREDAKIVTALTGGAKTFVSNTQVVQRQQSQSEDSDLKRDPLDKDDEVIVKLYQQLKKLKTNMVNERNWIADVQHIINHYRFKIGNVRQNMKQDAVGAYRLKVQIMQRHKFLARQRLQAKLKTVTDQLTKLTQTASDVSGKADSLQGIKSRLRQSISHIQSEIQRINPKGLELHD